MLDFIQQNDNVASPSSSSLAKMAMLPIAEVIQQNDLARAGSTVESNDIKKITLIRKTWPTRKSVFDDSVKRVVVTPRSNCPSIPSNKEQISIADVTQIPDNLDEKNTKVGSDIEPATIEEMNTRVGNFGECQNLPLQEELINVLTNSQKCGEVIHSIKPIQFIRLPEVLALLGISRSCLYDWLSPQSLRHQPNLPRQVKLGSRSVVWIRDEILLYMDSKINKEGV